MLDLVPIKERSIDARLDEDPGHSQTCRCDICCRLWQRGATYLERLRVSADDVPALLDEVERLRRIVDSRL